MTATDGADKKVEKSDDAWREQLTDAQYYVTRQAGTEPAFCGPHLDEKRAGVFHCICCDAPLFNADTKFESGTGWPSFFQPVSDEAVHEHFDSSHGMRRTEIVCKNCDAHLGHVFPDGPPPTGLRYCMNGTALSFVPDDPADTAL